MLISSLPAIHWYGGYTKFAFCPFLSRVSILTRDIDIANLSVRPSVTFRYCMKTA